MKVPIELQEAISELTREENLFEPVLNRMIQNRAPLRMLFDEYAGHTGPISATGAALYGRLETGWCVTRECKDHSGSGRVWSGLIAS